VDCCAVCQLDTDSDASCMPSEPLRGRPRQLPGHFRAIAPTVVRTFCGLAWGVSRQLPRQCPAVARHELDLFSGNCVDDSWDANRSAAWTSPATAGSFVNRCANHCANIDRQCVRRFPTTDRTSLVSRPAIVRLIHRTLRGHCEACGLTFM
jgi:hypothetical protein